MKELEKYQGAFKAALDVLNSARRQINEKSGCGYLADAIIRDIVALENMVAPPPPEIEEVEVVRWFCPVCKDSYAEVGTDRCCDPDASLVKLTGTLKRPKPQPVERTVEIIISNIGVVWNVDGTPCTEVCGKRGFFTYPEDPK